MENIFKRVGSWEQKRQEKSNKWDEFNKDYGTKQIKRLSMDLSEIEFAVGKNMSLESWSNLD